MQIGQTIQPTILPLIQDKPVSLEEFEAIARKQGATQQDLDTIHSKILEFARKFEEVSWGIQELQVDYRNSLRELYQGEARRLLEFHTRAIDSKLPHDAVRDFLGGVVDDLIEHRLDLLPQHPEFTRLYQVNLVLSHEPDEGCPVIEETNPSLQNLLGNIDREFSAMGPLRSDHMMIHAGSLLRANGGFLVLEVKDVLGEPGRMEISVAHIENGPAGDCAAGNGVLLVCAEPEAGTCAPYGQGDSHW